MWPFLFIIMFLLPVIIINSFKFPSCLCVLLFTVKFFYDKRWTIEIFNPLNSFYYFIILHLTEYPYSALALLVDMKGIWRLQILYQQTLKVMLRF